MNPGKYFVFVLYKAKFDSLVVFILRARTIVEAYLSRLAHLTCPDHVHAIPCITVYRQSYDTASLYTRNILTVI